MKPRAPVIIITPASPFDQDSVTLTCGKSTPIPSTLTTTYEWWKDGVRVTNQNREYTFSSVSFADGGTYSCSVTVASVTSDISQQVSFEGMFIITPQLLLRTVFITIIVCFK